MAFGSRRSFLINGIFSKTFDQTGWSINFFQFAMVHKSNPVAERLGFLHIVSSKKDCEIFPVKLTKKIPHLSSGKGIHSCSRFIKKKNFRAGEKCATYHKFTFHTTGKFTHRSFPERKKPAEIKKFLGFCLDFLPWHKIQTALIFHNFIHVHVLTHGILLCDNTDFTFQIRSVASKCLPANLDFSFRGQKQSGKQTDRSGFSCTVGAQKSKKFAGFYTKIQRIHSSEIVEFFGEIFGFDHLYSFPFVCIQISLYYT